MRHFVHLLTVQNKDSKNILYTHLCKIDCDELLCVKNKYHDVVFHSAAKCTDAKSLKERLNAVIRN